MVEVISVEICIDRQVEEEQVLSLEIHVDNFACYFYEFLLVSCFNILQKIWLVHVLVQFGMLRAKGLEFFDFFGSHLMHVSIFISIDKDILVSDHFFLLLSLLRLLNIFLLFLGSFALFLQAMQILNHSIVFVQLREIKWSFLEFIDEVMLASSVYEEFAHLKMSLCCGKEKTGLSIVIKMIDVDSMPQQELSNFQTTILGSPIKRILVVLVRIIEIILVSLQKFLDDLGLSCIIPSLPSLAR